MRDFFAWVTVAARLRIPYPTLTAAVMTKIGTKIMEKINRIIVKPTTSNPKIIIKYYNTISVHLVLVKLKVLSKSAKRQRQVVFFFSLPGSYNLDTDTAADLGGGQS